MSIGKVKIVENNLSRYVSETKSHVSGRLRRDDSVVKITLDMGEKWAQTGTRNGTRQDKLLITEGIMSTSHDWARDLIATGEFLLSRPEVEIGTVPQTKGWFFSEKDAFLGLVRATFPGKKTMDDFYVNFVPKGANLEFTISRNLVCRKLEPTKPQWECTPLLSPEEDAEMEDKPIDIDAPLAQAIRHDQQMERENDQ
jgi:hypothetical protein